MQAMVFVFFNALALFCRWFRTIHAIFMPNKAAPCEGAVEEDFYFNFHSRHEASNDADGVTQGV